MDIFYDFCLFWWVITGNGASKAFKAYGLIPFLGLLTKEILFEWIESCHCWILDSLKFCIYEIDGFI
jgi:hypothetical protein